MWRQLTLVLVCFLHGKRGLCQVDSPTCNMQHGNDNEITADCSRKQLTSLPSSLPEDVTHLLVNLNNLSDVTGMTRYCRLRVLDLSYNLVEKIDWSYFPDSLEELHLSHNSLTNVCTNTETTNFSSMILPKLRVLRLDQNNITTLTPHCFSDIGQSLQTLTLANNHMETIQNNTFGGLTSLTSLDLTSNNINNLQLDALTGLSGLTSLSLAFNQLTRSAHALPPGVFRRVGNTLTTLDLRGNEMGSEGGYPDEALADLTSMKKLQLDTFPYQGEASVFGPGRFQFLCTSHDHK